MRAFILFVFLLASGLSVKAQHEVLRDINVREPRVIEREGGANRGMREGGGGGAANRGERGEKKETPSTGGVTEKAGQKSVSQKVKDEIKAILETNSLAGGTNPAQRAQIVSELGFLKLEAVKDNRQADANYITTEIERIKKIDN